MQAFFSLKCIQAVIIIETKQLQISQVYRTKKNIKHTDSGKKHI